MSQSGYTFTVTASNKVSTSTQSMTILVQPELTSLTMSISKNDPDFSGNVAVVIRSATYYEDVDVYWNFGDDVKDTSHFEQINTNTPILRDHLYNCGEFAVSINMSNLVSWVVFTDIVVSEEEISGFNVSTVSTVASFGQNVLMTVRTDKGSNLTILLNYGDGTENVIHKNNFQRGATESVLQVRYNDTGRYFVNVFIYNRFSSANTTIGPVYIQNPVRNLKFSVSPVTQSPPSVVMVMVEYILDSLAPTHVTCKVKVNDEFQNATHTIELSKHQPLSVNVNTSDNVFGLVNIHAYCSNLLSRQDSYDQTFIQAVVQDLKIIADNLFTQIGGTIKFDFFIGKASYVNYTYSFGEGHTKTGQFRENLIEHRIITESYNYSNPGEYLVVFIVQNGVSKSEVTKSVWVLEAVTGLEMSRYYDQSVTTKNYGHGIHKNIFPVQRPVIFTTRVNSGNNLRYRWTFGDNVTKTTLDSLIQHSYQYEGFYTVTMEVFNDLYSTSESMTVEMHGIILPLRLTSNGPLKSYKDMEFTLVLAYPGTQPCFLWNIEGYSEKYLYGDESCQHRLQSMEGVSYVASNRSDTHKFSHVFTDEGLFLVSVMMFNEVSNLSISTSAVVSGISCFYPTVHFIGGKQTFDRPMKKLVSDWVVLEATALVNCESSVGPTYQWQIHKVVQGDTYLDQTLVPFDINIASVDKLEIYFTPGTLDPGLYKVTINVSMEGIAGLYTEGFSYLEVSKSPLVAEIKGGSARSVAYNKLLFMDGLTYSKDPGIKNDTKDHLRFEWWCRLKDEAFMESLTELIQIPTIEDVVNRSSNGEGCFGTGTGRLNVSEGQFEFSSAILSPESANVFRLFVRDGSSREAMYEQTVHVVEGDAPQIYIR